LVKAIGRQLLQQYGLDVLILVKRNPQQSVAMLGRKTIFDRVAALKFCQFLLAAPLFRILVVLDAIELDQQTLTRNKEIKT
jgi:hypothetical protein